MHLLRIPKLSVSNVARRYCSQKANTLFYENLANQRSIIRVSGDEVTSFLQGLITNDVNHLNAPSSNAALYTMFLNKPGRVLYDAIVFRCKSKENAVFIDCDRRIDMQLVKHLKMFRVRKKVDIDVVNDEYAVHTIFHRQDVDHKPDYKILDFNENVAISYDPRLHALGMRLLLPTNLQINNPYILPADQSYSYRKHRYTYGVGEGTIELQTEKCFPFEVNCDYMHGISFHKGCYLGQEFTARTYHTGVVRKRVMPIVIESSLLSECNALAYDTSILDENDQSIGKLKGVSDTNAIGMLRIDKALNAKFLKIGQFKAHTRRPEWWPTIKTAANRPSP